MIITLDTETEGLDATKYITGCITNTDMQTKHFKRKQDLWKEILKLGLREHKQGKTLTVYAFNHEYDFYAYAKMTDPNIRIYNNRPFIVSYVINDKETIKFLDMSAIYTRMNLEKVGKLIKYEKMEIDVENLKEMNIKKVREYNQRDSEIVMKAYQYLKNKLAHEGIRPKRMITISQIAISYIMKKLQILPKNKTKGILTGRFNNEIIKPKHPNKILQAYRIGRGETYRNGKHKEVTVVDINSLFPYALTRMRIPDLNTELLIDESNGEKWGIYERLSRIGVSECLMENKNDEYGLLQVSTKYGCYNPRKGTYLIGTWTHDEINKAIRSGYKLHKIRWSVVWKDDEEVPLKNIYYELYDKRHEYDDNWNKWFYKSIMNNSLGKMAQRLIHSVVRIDDIEQAKNYENNGWEIKGRIGYKYVYKKNTTSKAKKILQSDNTNTSKRKSQHNTLQRTKKDTV